MGKREKNMNSRERILTTLKGETPDRVPVSPFVQDEYLCWYWPEKESVDRVIDAHELAEELDFDLIAKHRKFEKPHFFQKSYPNWDLKQSESSSDGIRKTRLEIETPVKILVHEESCPESGAATAGVHAVTSKHILETAEDIEVFMEYLPALDDETMREMDETAISWRKIIGERGVLAPWGWAGVFNAACELRGIETLLMDPYDNEDLYKALMNCISDAQAMHSARLAETELECVGIQGNMANGQTVSADYFAEHVQPYEKKVIDAIHGAGAFTVYHNCGAARKLYDCYREMGITVWETVSEPPQGDNNLAEAKELLGADICLLGNLDQVEFIKTAKPDEVAERAREIMRIGKPGGRYIFSTSDFLEKNTPLDNVKAMIEAAKEEGRY